MCNKCNEPKRISHIGDDAKFISYGLTRLGTILGKRFGRRLSRFATQASIGHILWVAMDHLLK